MPSYAIPIGNAIVARIASLPGAPSTVILRKENVQYTIDTNPCVVVTVGMETPISLTFGGSILKTYTVGISIYRDNAGNLSSTMNLNPDFTLLCKQALDDVQLIGVPVVWSVDIIEAQEWEDQPFGQASEVSTFGLTVHTAELRTF